MKGEVKPNQSLEMFEKDVHGFLTNIIEQLAIIKKLLIEDREPSIAYFFARDMRLFQQFYLKRYGDAIQGMYARKRMGLTLQDEISKTNMEKYAPGFTKNGGIEAEMVNQIVGCIERYHPKNENWILTSLEELWRRPKDILKKKEDEPPADFEYICSSMRDLRDKNMKLKEAEQDSDITECLEHSIAEYDLFLELGPLYVSKLGSIDVFYELKRMLACTLMKGLRAQMMCDERDKKLREKGAAKGNPQKKSKIRRHYKVKFTPTVETPSDSIEEPVKQEQLIPEEIGISKITNTLEVIDLADSKIPEQTQYDDSKIFIPEQNKPDEEYEKIEIIVPEVKQESLESFAGESKSKFSKRAIEILENIYNLHTHTKLKYTEVISLIRTLTGEEKKGSGSRRKLILGNNTFCLHERHAKDRAQYVDPNVLKRLKDFFFSIGITPQALIENTWELSVSEPEIIEEDKPNKKKISGKRK